MKKYLKRKEISWAAKRGLAPLLLVTGALMFLLACGNKNRQKAFDVSETTEVVKELVQETESVTEAATEAVTEVSTEVESEIATEVNTQQVEESSQSAS